MTRTILGFNMAFSDLVVLTALRELVGERGQHEIITYREIAHRAGCSERTVIRAMKRMSGDHFRKAGGRRTGYRYSFEPVNEPAIGGG